MKDDNGKTKYQEDVERWEEKTLKPALEKAGRSDAEFTTLSGIEAKPLYTSADYGESEYDDGLGFPGEFPYTRGVQPSMYRGRPWTMRQFSGFGSAEDTNSRFHYLLANGQTGLSVAFHMPTLMGYDSDHERSKGEVGVCGVAIDTLADMETLFDGIPLDKVSTSMTINGPAAILLAMYVAVAEKQGVSSHQVKGTIQNDILKEYIAQKSWIFPPRPSMRIITDIFGYCQEQIPNWNTISISGYHIREAGSTAVQELAFTLADGIAYVEAGIEQGLNVDDFAPRLSFFFNAHNDFFEEIAKYRAARRIWAKEMKRRFDPKDERSLLCRFHTQTAGCSLTAQQPENNVIRVALQALAAVMGGTQSLHTNSRDEVMGLPTEESVTIALRTQQIIAHESGVTNSIDPMGGSYYLEALTDEMERRAMEYINKIDELGGMIAAIETGYPQHEIMDAAFQYQRDIEQKNRIVVGVNEFDDGSPRPAIEMLKIDPRMEPDQVEKLARVRSQRDQARVDECLAGLRKAAEGTDNLMPHILDCVRAYTSVGEIIGELKEVFGVYTDPGFF